MTHATDAVGTDQTLAALGAGTFRLDLAAQTVTFSPAAAVLASAPPGATHPSSVLLDRLTPSDRARFGTVTPVAKALACVCEPQGAHGAFELRARASGSVVTGLVLPASDEVVRTQALLESLLANASAGIAMWDRELRYLHVNDAFGAFNHVHAPDLVGTRLGSHVPEVRAALEPALAHVLVTGEALVNFEARGRDRKAGGRWIDFLANYYPVRAHGEIVGVAGIVFDITERKRMERAFEVLARSGPLLAESLDVEKTLDAVTTLAVPAVCDACAVYLADDDGAVQRRALRHEGAATHERIAFVMDRFVDAVDAPHGHRAVMRTGVPELVPEVTEAALRGVARDEPHLADLRTMMPTSWMIVPLAVHGRTIGAVSFSSYSSERHYASPDLALAIEIGARAALAIENARLYGAAREASRAKDEFLAVVSHELRTPLMAILGWAHILRSKRREETTVERAALTIERNAQLQARLVDDLLDTSRVITGQLRLNLTPMDMGAVVRSAIDVVRPAADARGVRLAAVIDPGLDAVVGDAMRMQQVVWNLLSNAVKFSHAGGAVHVWLGGDGRVVELVVRDEGRGIPAWFLPRVFERFQQADASSTRAQGGLGLGLSIVRHLVELHGGAVVAESTGENLGATFRVRIPRASATIGDREPSRPKHRVTYPPPGMATALDGVRVLLVEDDADARELLATVLLEQGALVDAAADVPTATVMFERTRPDVVVSDLSMPGEDGFALVAWIRARSVADGGRLPVIALSAHASRTDAHRSVSAGFDAHVAKPIDPDEFVRRVVSVMRSE